MQTIGERLEEARKKKGISIREAAEATKIRGDYLSRFENNQFDINLTELYVRGFLRAYANFLKLPSDRILNDYAALGRGDTRTRAPSREVYGRMDVSIASADERSEPPSAAPAPAEPIPTPPPARRAPSVSHGSGLPKNLPIDPALLFKIVKWAGLVLVAVLAIWGIKSLFSGDSGRPADRSTPTAVAPITGPTVTLVALDSVRVKVESADDGRVLLPETTLVRGQNQVVAKPGTIYITYSDGKNLEVEVNGKRYPMPATGNRAQIR
jgi:transcriptional regulator with XRE-family HTH domain